MLDKSTTIRGYFQILFGTHTLLFKLFWKTPHQFLQTCFLGYHSNVTQNSSHGYIQLRVIVSFQWVLTCLKPTMEAPEQCVKYVQS